jgi:hypothetical protein
LSPEVMRRANSNTVSPASGRGRLFQEVRKSGGIVTSANGLQIMQIAAKFRF